MKPHTSPRVSSSATSAATRGDRELLAIVQRLKQIVLQHRAPAKRMGIELSPALLVRIVEALLDEATGRTSLPWEDSIEGFFSSGRSV